MSDEIGGETTSLLHRTFSLGLAGTAPKIWRWFDVVQRGPETFFFVFYPSVFVILIVASVLAFVPTPSDTTGWIVIYIERIMVIILWVLLCICGISDCYYIRRQRYIEEHYSQLQLSAV